MADPDDIRIAPVSRSTGRAPRYRPLPLPCPDCASAETVHTSKHLGETSHLCRDCDHAWTTRDDSETAGPGRR